MLRAFIIGGIIILFTVLGYTVANAQQCITEGALVAQYGEQTKSIKTFSGEQVKLLRDFIAAKQGKATTDIVMFDKISFFDRTGEGVVLTILYQNSCVISLGTIPRSEYEQLITFLEGI